MPEAIRVENLSIRFERGGQVIQALNGVSFDLAKGEVLTVIGESGSGKSIMLRALLGLTPAYGHVGGRVTVFGRDLRSMSAAELQRLRGGVVSVVFQEPMSALDPVFTIGAQIVETIIRHEALSHRAALHRARELLELVAVPAAARRLANYPHEMSGGMRQRAMIALALAGRPQVLLADEPTTSLDATVQIQLLLLLRRLQRDLGLSLIFVTHDMAVAAEVSDRVAVMYAGRLVEIGGVEPILLLPRHPYTRALLRSTVHSGMRRQTLETIPGSPPDLRALPPGCAFAPRCRFAESACRASTPEIVLRSDGRGVACRRQDEAGLA